jgi:hypothetical protein
MRSTTYRYKYYVNTGTREVDGRNVNTAKTLDVEAVNHIKVIKQEFDNVFSFNMEWKDVL